MSKITWNPSWDIGVEDIDQQHREWVEIFNRLEVAFLNKKPNEMEPVLKKTLKKITDYTVYHFQTEEELMTRINYPETYSHWRLHKEFKQIVYENYRRTEEGESILGSQVLSLMKGWFLEHTQKEDKKIGLYLESLCNSIAS